MPTLVKADMHKQNILLLTMKIRMTWNCSPSALYILSKLLFYSISITKLQICIFYILAGANSSEFLIKYYCLCKDFIAAVHIYNSVLRCFPWCAEYVITLGYIEVIYHLDEMQALITSAKLIPMYMYSSACCKVFLILVIMINMASVLVISGF